MTVAVIPVPGLPMIQPGNDLAILLGDAIERAGVGLKARDVVAVCQKVVSKAEGAVVSLDDVVASPFAERLAAHTEGGKDPRAVEVVLREAARIVRMDRGHVICETRDGWVCANAGVDESNGLEPGTLTLLPRDADGSAAALWPGGRFITPSSRWRTRSPRRPGWSWRRTAPSPPRSCAASATRPGPPARPRGSCESPSSICSAETDGRSRAAPRVQ